MNRHTGVANLVYCFTMRWIVVILGFLMLVAPAFGRGSNIAGLAFSAVGGLGGIATLGAMTGLLIELRMKRRIVDRITSVFFVVIGVSMMIGAAFAKGAVASLLPDSDAWYGLFDVLWFFIPKWLVYGFMVGFGTTAVFMGSQPIFSLRDAKLRDLNDR